MAVVGHMVNPRAFDHMERHLAGALKQHPAHKHPLLLRQLPVQPVIAPSQSSRHAEGCFVIVIPVGGAVGIP
ncbi:hypothetical protein D3C76_1486860 [compost metagenome]